MTIFSGFSHRKIICFPSQTVILEKSPANKSEKKSLGITFNHCWEMRYGLKSQRKWLSAAFVREDQNLMIYVVSRLMSVSFYGDMIWSAKLIIRVQAIYFSLISALWSHTVISAKTSEALRGENYMYFWISKITFCTNPQNLFQPLNFQKGEFFKCLWYLFLMW